MNEAHIPIGLGDDPHRTNYLQGFITDDLIATFDFFNYLTGGCPIQGGTRSGRGVVVTVDMGKFQVITDYVKTIFYTRKNELFVRVISKLITPTCQGQARQRLDLNVKCFFSGT